MKQNITRALIDRLKPKEKPYEIRCTRIPGFLVRVQPTGSSSFYCEYARGKRQALGKTAHTELDDAQRRARSILSEYANGVDPKAARREKPNLSYGEYLDKEYGPWIEGNQKSGAATYKRLRSAFKPFLNETLTSISLLHLEKWRSKRLKGGTSASTLNRDIGAFKASLNRAVEWGMIKENPVSAIKKIRVENVTPPRYLKPEERERLFAAIDARETRRREERARFNKWRVERKMPTFPCYEGLAFTDHLKPMVIISLNTGLRRSELFSLTWDQVHLDGNEPYITVLAAHAKSSKTRHIPLNRKVIDVLEGLKAIVTKKVTNLVFESADGKPFDNVSSSWEKVRKEAGLESFRWHDMRHDFASQLVMKGVNLNVVRDLLGHADYKMTLRYAHLSPAQGAEAVNLL